MYNQFSKILLECINPCEQILDCLSKTINNSEKKDGFSEFRSIYEKENLKIYHLIHENFNDKTNPDIDLKSKHFQEIKDYINGFDEIVIEQQTKDHFSPLFSDRFIIKYGKLGKLFFLNVHWFFIDVTNKIRSIIRLQPIPKHYWTHQIQNQNLATLVYFIYFLKNIKPVVSDLLEFTNQVFQEIKTIDHKIETCFLIDKQAPNESVKLEISSLQTEIANKKNSILLHFEELTKQLNSSFEDLYSKLGTIEFPSKNVNKERLNKQLNRALKNLVKHFNEYQIRNFALFEHWRLVYEIRTSSIEVSEAFQKNSSLLDNVLQEKLSAKDSYIVNLLSTSFKEIQSNQNLDQVQEEFLSNNLLKQIIPEFLESIMEIDTTSILDSLIENSLVELGKSRKGYLLPYNKDWGIGKKTPKLRETNIDEIVNGCFNQFIKETVSNQKRELIISTQNSIANLNELSGIIAYAIEFYKTKDQDNDENQKQEFIKGIERATKKAEENKLYNANLISNLLSQLNSIRKNFILEIISAISLENLHKKQAEMIRKKNIRDAKQIVFSSLQFLKISFENLKKNFTFWSQQVQLKYSTYREALGLVYSSKTIASELSNYLSETQTAISRLPLMYQKLFMISPLTNEKFGIDRPKVMLQLEEAYSNWTSGKFAPTCLIGETGSGSTTMVNLFLLKFGHQYTVYRLSSEKRIIGEKDFLKFLKLAFNDFEYETIEDLIEKINNLKSKRIIIFENVHQLFLRKSQAFENLHLFFYLISQTNSKIFWLSSCLHHTFNYLDYTQNMSQYFGHIIKLDALNKEQIIEIITKRHKFSGFKLNFIPPEDFSIKRSYKKLTESEKQDFLQMDFFNRLYHFSQNNLSLALIFWLRSVVNVEENNFNLQYRQLNFSFLNSLSNEQIICLHSLLLHGNLSVEEYSELLGFQKRESFAKLMVLTDDGILIKNNNFFYINPLVYRQVVSHLSALNYLH